MNHDENVRAKRGVLTNAMHAMHADQRIKVDIELATALGQAWHDYDAAIAQTMGAEVERLTRVLQEVRESLRIECGEFDANGWPDDLHPADVIQKYLARAVHYEVERLKDQVAAQAEVIAAARAYRTAADESEDDGEDERTMDAGHAFFNALARVDALEHAQRNAAAVTQLQADMEAKA